MIPLAMWMARYEISRFWRLAGAGSVAALSIATVLTESRGALVALGVLAVAELVRVRKKPGALIVLLAAFGTLIAFAPSSVLQRFHSIKVSGQATNGNEGSTIIRKEVLIAGLNMIEENPLVGVGLDQYKALSTRYNGKLIALGPEGNIAHNTYMQLAAEGGLPTLFIFVAILFVGFLNCRAIQQLQPGSPAAELSGAIRLSLLGYSLAAFFLTVPFLVSFWLMISCPEFSRNRRRWSSSGSCRGRGCKSPEAYATLAAALRLDPEENLHGMKILFVLFITTVSTGCREAIRNYSLVRALDMEGHEVTLLSFGDLKN